MMLAPGVARGERDALERAAAAAALRALEEAPGRGSVLCFLPGAGEVGLLCNKLPIDRVDSYANVIYRSSRVLVCA